MSGQNRVARMTSLRDRAREWLGNHIGEYDERNLVWRDTAGYLAALLTAVAAEVRAEERALIVREIRERAAEYDEESSFRNALECHARTIERGEHLTPPSADPAGERACVVREFSSRACELGTKSCEVRHSAGEPCEACDGSGSLDTSGMACVVCNGTGKAK